MIFHFQKPISVRWFASSCFYLIPIFTQFFWLLKDFIHYCGYKSSWSHTDFIVLPQSDNQNIVITHHLVTDYTYMEDQNHVARCHFLVKICKEERVFYFKRFKIDKRFNLNYFAIHSFPIRTSKIQSRLWMFSSFRHFRHFPCS